MRKSMATTRFSVVAMLLASLAAPNAVADEFSDWQKFRAEKFSELTAAHPTLAADLSEITSRTAKMVAAYASPHGTNLDLPPVIWSAANTPVVIYDAPFAPRMVVIPAGEFTMGSRRPEAGHIAREGPRQRVRIGYPLAVSMFPIVYGEFAWFVADSGYQPRGHCMTLEPGETKARAGRDWRNPGFAQTLRTPVTCIAFDDATAYAAWLSKKTGQIYRLLSESEYEYAVRAGTVTAYWWGDDRNAACEFANGFDLDAKPYNGAAKPLHCHDGHALISQAGSFKPNAFGLLDIVGNVGTWTADCWHSSLAGVPTDGSPDKSGDCSRRAVRSGSWLSIDLRSASRSSDWSGDASADRGFRLARVL